VWREKTNKKVLKLGGSLLEIAHDLVLYLLKQDLNVLIVPGGGPFANIVRHYSRSLTDDVAHWMAVLAMEQYAFFLAGGTGCRLLDDIIDVPRGVSVLLPFKLVYGNDPLPHSWEVTSDAIAAWIAGEFEADLVIAKDVDGIYINDKLARVIRASELRVETCIDTTLPKLISKYKLNCTIINGAYFNRVSAALCDKDVIGTKVIV
jgi:aspartokinase-like uncharacterized kinase